MKVDIIAAVRLEWEVLGSSQLKQHFIWQVYLVQFTESQVQRVLVKQNHFSY